VWALKAFVCTATVLAAGCGTPALDARAEAEAVGALAGCYEIRTSKASRWRPTALLPLDTMRLAYHLTSERDTEAHESPAYYLHLPGIDPLPFPTVSFWVPMAHNTVRVYRVVTDAGSIMHLRRNEDGRLEGIGWGEGMGENEGVRFRVVAEPFPCADTVGRNRSSEAVQRDRAASSSRPPHN
jgi:hypothetical protein